MFSRPAPELVRHCHLEAGACEAPRADGRGHIEGILGEQVGSLQSQLNNAVTVDFFFSMVFSLNLVSFSWSDSLLGGAPGAVVLRGRQGRQRLDRPRESGQVLSHRRRSVSLIKKGALQIAQIIAFW